MRLICLLIGCVVVALAGAYIWTSWNKDRPGDPGTITPSPPHYRLVPFSEKFAMSENVVYGEVVAPGANGKIRVMESLKGSLSGTVDAPVYTNYAAGTPVIWFDRILTANPDTRVMSEASLNSSDYKLAKLLMDLPSALEVDDPAEALHVAQYLGCLFMSVRIEGDGLSTKETTTRLHEGQPMLYSRFPWQARGVYEARAVGSEVVIQPSSPLDEQISRFLGRHFIWGRKLPDGFVLKLHADAPRQMEGVSYEDAEQFLVRNLTLPAEKTTSHRSEIHEQLYHASIHSLARMRSVDAVPEVVKGMDSEDLGIFKVSTDYLRSSGVPEAARILKDRFHRLQGDTDALTRRQSHICQALIKLNAPDIRGILEEMALKSDHHAYDALAKHGNGQSFGVLIQSLENIAKLQEFDRPSKYRAAFDPLEILVHRSSLSIEPWMEVEHCYGKEEQIAKQWTEWWTQHQEVFRVIRSSERATQP